jgi:hypothetical protein
MRPEFLLPTRRQRLRSIAGVVLAMIVAAVFSNWLGDYLASAEAQGVCAQVAATRNIVSSLALILFAFLWFLAWQAARIFWHGQFPPPRARVIRATRIRRGAQATIIGTVHVLLALAIALLLVYPAGDLIALFMHPVEGVRCVAG